MILRSNQDLSRSVLKGHGGSGLGSLTQLIQIGATFLPAGGSSIEIAKAWHF